MYRYGSPDILVRLQMFSSIVWILSAPRWKIPCAKFLSLWCGTIVSHFL